MSGIEAHRFAEPAPAAAYAPTLETSSAAVASSAEEKPSKASSFFKWGANISALGGGAAMAGFPEICLSPWSYGPFVVSHVIWTVFAWRIKEKELMALNLGALLLDFWAIAARV